MSTFPYTNTTLLDLVKRKSALPENSDWTDQNILDLANEVVRDTLLPVIARLRSEYNIHPLSVAVTAGTASYRVNSRYAGQMLRDIQLVDGTALISLPQISPEETTSTETGRPRAFYMRGNSFVLYPTPDVAYTLAVTGMLSMSSLTEVANTGKITSINTGTFQVDVDSLPSSWTTGTIVDFIKGTPGYEILDIDYSVASASGSTITFTSLPSGLSVGDYVAPQATTPIPQVMQEMQSVLTEYTVAKVLKAMGQNDEASIANESATALLQNITGMLTPRIQGAQKKFRTRLL